MRYVQAGQPIESSFEGAPSGLIAAGSIGYRVLDELGNTVKPRATTGISEVVRGATSDYYTRLEGAELPVVLGLYKIVWDNSTDGVLTPTNNARDEVEIIESASVQIAPVQTGIVPWCTQWITGADVIAAYPGTDSAKAANAALLATSMLFDLSGGRFPGICSDTVTPTWDNYCGPWTYERGVMLQGRPVISVDQVRIGSTVVNPDTYWLEGQLLVNSPIGSTVQIDYTFGEVAPELAIEAALALAGELIKAPDACRLPENVTQITRQGVTESKRAASEVAKTRMTGIRLVDLFLATYNPTGAAGPPAIWSPNLPAPRRVS